MCYATPVIQIEDTVAEQVAQKETEMKNLMDERIRNYKERYVCRGEML